MELAIATVCLSGTLDEKLQAIARAEFKAVEIFENDLLSYNGTPAEVRRMADDLGLRIGVSLRRAGIALGKIEARAHMREFVHSRHGAPGGA